ncbi:MAG: hypothetical protein GEV28_02280 [Actinophytocola sp.]|uniref:peptidylprolyl isomerase n=1 Tax=Actinophytocola sp. TaxID=1872138 RepID=UPI00132A3266|nr:peptidylprolyl isomerase [Actinophytocola sp.]MPZ79271.1 hypothetical protein [Actinophytocola sp.]
MLPKRLAHTALACVPLLVFAACSGDDPSTAATVNGTEIPASAVADLAAVIAEDPQYDELDGDDDQIQQQINADALNQLIFAAVLQDGAAELDIEITDEDIADTIAEVVPQFGGDEEDMYEQLEEQGLARDEVDRQLELFAIENAVTSELSPEISDIATAYEDGVPARHILVADTDAATEAMNRIGGGEDFAEVAAETSTDGSAAQGGDLGFIQPGTTVPEFEDALFGADEGELVGPIESDFGFHVIERLEKPALEDVQDEIRTSLEQATAQEGQAAYQEFITGQMQEAEIEIDPEFGEWDAEIGQVVPDDPIEPELPDDLDDADLDDLDLDEGTDE